MYQIKCDGYILYDPRDDDFIVKSPKCKLAINTVGEASFTIHSKHPHYGKLNKLLSVFEIIQDGEAIFKGRMTNDSKDFDNKKQVDLEGAMAYFNDSIVRPFTFPDDFLNDAGYVEAAENGNVVEFFLKCIIEWHNSQVEPFQQFRLGRVTVSDPNNYLSRSESSYKKSWEILKEKLFESSLGGYLCIRYEVDGNYIDYLADFDSDNTQKIVFGENLLDLLVESDATETYSAIIPLGADIGGSGSSKKLTIEDLPDGDITDDIVKKGDTLYSKKAVAAFGWIYAPVSETTWDDVKTDLEALKRNGVGFLENKASKFWETLTAKAIDLHLSDKEIEAFRIYKNVYVESTPHEQTGKNKLGEIDIDIENPQNTKITVGESKRVLTDKTNTALRQAEAAKKGASQTSVDLSKKVDKTDNDQVVAMINKSTKPIVISQETIDVEGYKFGLDEDGTLTAHDANISGKFEATGKRSAGTDGEVDVSVTIDDGEITSKGTSTELFQSGAQQIGTGTDYAYRNHGSLKYLLLPWLLQFGYALGDDAFTDIGGIRSTYGSMRGDPNMATPEVLEMFGDWHVSGDMTLASGEAVTSDENKKNTISNLADAEAYSILFDYLIPCLFKYNDGQSDRLHVGFVAQQVKQALDAAGIDSKDFAGLCIKQNKDGTQDWSLRYSEFIALLTMELQRLKKRVADLECKQERT